MVQQIFDAASLGSLYALMALGIALVFGVMRLVNFAYGELIMIGGYVAFVVSDAPAFILLVAVVLAVCITALLMERIAFRPVRGADPATMLVTSFALSVGLQSLVTLTAGSRPKGLDVLPTLTHQFTIRGTSIPWLDVATLATTVALLAGFATFLKYSEMGIQVRAAAEDFRMARLLGVRANRVIAVTFALSGILAGAVAILLVARTGTVSPAMGVGPALIAFVATVVGGMGSLFGAALGGFLLGVVSVTLQVELPEPARVYRDAFIFAIVIFVLLLRPQGLAGSRALRERV